MVEGGAGSIAQRVADELGDADAPERPGAFDHAARRPRRRRRATSSTVSARHAVVAVPPALALEIAFDPVLPDDRLTLYRNAVARPGDEDARRLRRAVLARRRVQRPDLRAGIGVRRSRSTRRRASGTPGVIASFTFGPVAERVRRARPGRAAPGGARRADGAVRTACGVAGRSSSRPRGGTRSGRAAARSRTSRPASSRRYGPLLREPFGRVHWAGTETATTSHGAIDGAVRSGERAARRS